MSNINNKINTNLYEKFHDKTTPIKYIPDVNNFTYGDILSLIEKVVKTHNVSKIIDLGCGPGSISFYLLNKGYEVLGVDISKKAIDSCNKTKKIYGFKNGEFIKKSVEDFVSSYRKKCDLIIMSELIEHLNDDDAFIKKIRKILNKNGVIFITTPSVKSPLHRMGLLTEFDKRVGHLRRYSADSLKRKVARAGYKVVYIKKTEGILRNSIFNFRAFGIFVKILNKFPLAGKAFSILDHISIKIFGESDIQLVATKK